MCVCVIKYYKYFPFIVNLYAIVSATAVDLLLLEGMNI